jgi:hypothetical protein
MLSETHKKFFIQGHPRHIWRLNTTVISFLDTPPPPNIVDIINKTPITIHSRLPLPYKAVNRLHSKNIQIIINFCFNHQIPIPPEIHTLNSETNKHPSTLPVKKNLLTRTNPIIQLIQFIKEKNIIITQADKTPHLCLFTKQKYIQLLNNHLQDVNTYQIIPMNRVNAIKKVLSRHIHTLYRNINKTRIPNKKTWHRSFKILPKLHKHIHTWPQFPDVPKTRPVVNDSNSITTHACRAILPFLQSIERNLPHICHSSIHVIHKLRTLSTLINTEQYYIITADVNDMYTNINTQSLIQILQTDKYQFKYKEAILTFINEVTKYTTFQCNNLNFLQKKGLPMGGPLSGTLANIYMSHYEEQVMSQYTHLSHPPYLLRYIDDILILTPSNTISTQIISDLSTATKLRITATSPNKHAVFLDLKIILHNNGIITSTYYKFASPVSRSFFHNPKKETSILISQILRVWRLNNDNDILTQQIHHIFSFLHFQRCPKPILQSLQTFLLPIQKPDKTYSSMHLLCIQCQSSCSSHNTHILKATLINNTLIASRTVLNCLSTCSTILCKTKINKLLFLSPLQTIHDTLTNYNSLLDEVTPIGNINQFNINKLFIHIKHLLPADIIQSHDYTIPVHIFPILHNPSTAYGIKTGEKALKKLSNAHII